MAQNKVQYQRGMSMPGLRFCTWERLASEALSVGPRRRSEKSCKSSGMSKAKIL